MSDQLNHNSVKNPLFVVTNKGKDVEEVSNYLEVIVKKLGLTPFVEFIDELFTALISQVTSYALFLVIKDFFDDLVAKLEELVAILDPVFSNYFPQSFSAFLGSIKKG